MTENVNQVMTEEEIKKALLNGELLTIKEAAELLKVTVKTVYEWIKKGKVRVIKAFGFIDRIPLCDIVAQMEVKCKSAQN